MSYRLAESSWDEREIAAMQAVIESGRFTMGEKVREFEAAFAEHFGARYAVMTNSGSSANLLMIAAMRYAGKLPQGSGVVVPAVAWSTTYAPIAQYGCRIILADVDPETLNMDPKSLPFETMHGFDGRAPVVLTVNVLGNPSDVGAIEGASWLLEDNCEGMGAVGDFHGTPYACGSFGLIGTFSTFFAHHISTMEGGVAVTDDPELYRTMLMLRAHGWTRDLPDGNGSLFRFVLPGYNLRPLELSGAIGLEQLRKLSAMVEQRRENARIFHEVVSRFEWLTPQKETDGGRSSYMGLAMLTDTPERRDRLRVALDRHGIEHRPILTGNFARTEMARWFDYRVPAGGLPGANRIHDCGLFVGNHPRPLGREMDLLSRALKEVA